MSVLQVGGEVESVFLDENFIVLVFSRIEISLLFGLEESDGLLLVMGGFFFQKNMQILQKKILIKHTRVLFHIHKIDILQFLLHTMLMLPSIFQHFFLNIQLRHYGLLI